MSKSKSKKHNTSYSIVPDRILSVGDPCLVLMPQEDDEAEPITERAATEYFAAVETTVKVPIKVKVHAKSNTVYSFIRPTHEDVERALKSQ